MQTARCGNYTLIDACSSARRAEPRIRQRAPTHVSSSYESIAEMLSEAKSSLKFLQHVFHMFHSLHWPELGLLARVIHLWFTKQQRELGRFDAAWSVMARVVPTTHLPTMARRRCLAKFKKSFYNDESTLARKRRNYNNAAVRVCRCVSCKSANRNRQTN